MASLDTDSIRSGFPALSRIENGVPVAYLDGPGGTQVPASVIDAMAGVLRSGVSNLGGGFGASDDAVEIVASGREAIADLFNATPQEISFGQNMTSITFAVSRALARSWRPGDVVVVTSLDHDANFTPWVLAARDAGVEVRVAEFDTTTGELPSEAFAAVLDERVRLVALCAAANSIGTTVDVRAVTALAHQVGALTYVDAVHAGPHRLIDVAALGCDFLVASAYKFFGPHTGVLYGRFDLLDDLDFYKVRPATDTPPEKVETGTQSFESIAGVIAAVDYLSSLGVGGTRRQRLESAFSLIESHEGDLTRRFIEGVGGMPHVSVVGVPAADRRRVSTFAVSVEGMPASEASASLAKHGIYSWAGNYYAVNAMDRLGFGDNGGLLRIGFVHYNTGGEVDRVLEALAGLR
jgi:cysteine desulfurase family protein (TIGR01976 family)